METNLYRLTNDGSHFVGIKYIKKTFHEDDNSLNNYASEYVFCNGKSPLKRGVESDKNKALKECFSQCSDVKYKNKLEVMKEHLANNGFDYSDEEIKSYIHKEYKNLKSRLKRFQNKAYNNDWNYFVTFTYDDNKLDEESFRSSIKKTLANFHYRYGWKYMGVFERSKDNRLHLHCLMYIPKNYMRGKIIIKKDYSTSDHKMRIVHINTFFDMKYGRNDFVEINLKGSSLNNILKYLVKYISKSNEKIFYSRGIATYVYMELTEDDIICSFNDDPFKYIFFDYIKDNVHLNMRC